MPANKPNPPPLRIGVDTGGTFTDFVSLGSDGIKVDKRRSTPEDPSRSILDGLAALSAGGAIAEVVHGSTVATNAVLERKGARVALVATEGFSDVLAIGRQTRSELYNFFVPARLPIVPPDLVFGVPERLDAQGNEIVPLDMRAVDRLAKLLARRKVDIVAVCLLHSYADPIHERRVAERLRRAGLRVCSSHEVLPEYREFERWSTTVANAYVTPLMDRYLGKLEQELGDCRLRIMQSNGGTISAAAARGQAVRTLLSGPAAGVIGARAVAGMAGFDRIISFDMGGTSTDTCLVDRTVSTTADSVIGDFPVRIPMIDIHTVGAGGGSIASVDGGGALRAGPQSAGATPGPACYGAGEELTVTDANLLLGRLDEDWFLGGRMKLDVARARHAAEKIARRLDLTVLQLAEGVVQVANANMERALRVVSLERGHDPRDFALLAFGGAGGMHACELAQRMEIPDVIVPRHAGVLSALGMLLADVTKDYSASVLRRTDLLEARELEKRFKPIIEAATAGLRAEGFPPSCQVIERQIDLRYAGQSSELTLPFTDTCRREFDQLHSRLYGYSNSAWPVEIVNLRVRASGITSKPMLPRRPERTTIARPRAVRPSRFDGRMWRTGFYRWDDLTRGARGKGPAVVTGSEATVVVPPNAAFRVDGFGNIIVQAGADGGRVKKRY